MPPRDGTTEFAPDLRLRRCAKGDGEATRIQSAEVVLSGLSKRERDEEDAKESYRGKDQSNRWTRDQRKKTPDQENQAEYGYYCTKVEHFVRLRF